MLEGDINMKNMNMMKAIVIENITKAEDIKLSDFPIPKVCSGWVLIKVKAFGLNHSEKILRLEEINENYIQKPIIPGIECVGEIADSSDSNFKIGQKVMALMGGMGRSFNGSYAEYTLIPSHHVFAINSKLQKLSWEELAAIPETYFTAWGSLFECLNLNNKDKLLIRGATCSLGYAAIQIAKAMGCYVIATTHKKEKLPLLEKCDMALIDNGKLESGISGVNKALELVGAKTLYDTLRTVEKGGIVCHTGILGGLYAINNFDAIKFIPNGLYLTSFYSNFPTQNIINDILNFFEEHNLKPCIGKVFSFEDIREALICLDYGKIDGKIVVKM